MIEARLTPTPNLAWPIVWEGIVLLCAKERCVLAPYRDQKGIPTQGWGETLGVTMTDAPWTDEEADRRLCERLTSFTNGVRAMIVSATTANQLAAMVVLAYNIGLPGFHGSTVLHQHNLGHTAEACRAFLMWDKETDPVTHVLVVSNGLTLRRHEEAKLYLKGDHA